MHDQSALGCPACLCEFSQPGIHPSRKHNVFSHMPAHCVVHYTHPLSMCTHSRERAVWLAVRSLGSGSSVSKQPHPTLPLRGGRFSPQTGLRSLASLASSLSQPMTASCVQWSSCMASRVRTIRTPCGLVSNATVVSTSSVLTP